MPGLRVSGTREWPEIFEKHPVPWTHDSATDTGGRSLRDANDVVIDTAKYPYHVAGWLFQLYLYGVADLYDDITGWAPTAILRRPLPWSIETCDTQMTTDEADVWQCETVVTPVTTHLCTYGTTAANTASSAHYARYKTTTVRKYVLKDAAGATLLALYDKEIIVALYELSRLA